MFGHKSVVLEERSLNLALWLPGPSGVYFSSSLSLSRLSEDCLLAGSGESWHGALGAGVLATWDI